MTSPASRWRVTLHRRWFQGDPSSNLSDTQITELVEARSRRLETTFKEPAQFGFTLPGRSPATALIRELEHEVAVYRGQTLMFRGPITQSHDTITEQAHTVAFTAHDYLAMLTRRPLTKPREYRQTDQDDIVAALIADAIAPTPSAGTPSFRNTAGGPMRLGAVFPDGALSRPLSGRRRDRSYEAQALTLELITNLSNVLDGFDFDMAPGRETNTLRTFYPRQGVVRDDRRLIYGVNVASLTRTLNSQEYANYVRVVGDATDDGPPKYGEAWSTDAHTLNPARRVGLWMTTSSASDAGEQSTLTETAAGVLSRSSTVTPSYAPVMAAGVWSPGYLNMGDVVTFVLNSGRLDEVTPVRVLGIDYEISDEDSESVRLTVGRPEIGFFEAARYANRRISALERRRR